MQGTKYWRLKPTAHRRKLLRRHMNVVYKIVHNGHKERYPIFCFSWFIVRTETTDGLQQVDLWDQGLQEQGWQSWLLKKKTDVAACNLARCTRDIHLGPQKWVGSHLSFIWHLNFICGRIGHEAECGEVNWLFSRFLGYYLREDRSSYSSNRAQHFVLDIILRLKPFFLLNCNAGWFPLRQYSSYFGLSSKRSSSCHTRQILEGFSCAAIHLRLCAVLVHDYARPGWGRDKSSWWQKDENYYGIKNCRLNLLVFSTNSNVSFTTFNGHRDIMWTCIGHKAQMNMVHLVSPGNNFVSYFVSNCSQDHPTLCLIF